MLLNRVELGENTVIYYRLRNIGPATAGSAGPVPAPLYPGHSNSHVIGRVKRAQHRDVQSRFLVIYVYDCLWATHTKKIIC